MAVLNYHLPSNDLDFQFIRYFVSIHDGGKIFFQIPREVTGEKNKEDSCDC